jgi:hypothetical protein
MAARESERAKDCRIHIRGETTNLGEPVPRGVLQLVSIVELPRIEPRASGRVQLAEWLAGDDNALTPRVAVNRIWLHLFGRGIVATVDDFGSVGSRPSHPELLDYLAARFVADGWSVKRLIREIVLSRTYQLTSAADSNDARQCELDPDNVLLWRHNARRLEVEAFRDAVLAVSGRLDRSPPSQSFLAQWNPYEHDRIKTSQPFVTPEMIESPHRSVYLPVLRDSLPELYTLFDFADPNRVVGQRDESTLPSQALFLMNSPWIIERAESTAQRLLADEELSDGRRIELLYELGYGRLPTKEETLQALDYIAATTASAEQRVTRWTSYCQTILASGEFRYVQ